MSAEKIEEFENTNDKISFLPKNVFEKKPLNVVNQFKKCDFRREKKSRLN